MLSKADIRQVTFEDLLALQTNQVPESHTLDYKRDFPTDREGRVRLAADVVAFANTRGGDLVLGVEEKGGVIARIVPVQLTDVDKDLLGLVSAFTDLIEPKIVGMLMHPVKVDGGHVVVIRVPPSFHGPHRVTRTGTFYTRTSTGIDPMDITALRSAFLQSATAIEKAAAFRELRVSGLRDRPMPAPLAEGPLGILHIIPVSSLFGAVRNEMTALKSIAQAIQPPLDNGGWGPRINFDGAMSASSGESLRAYTQVFRDGSIESVLSLKVEYSDVVFVATFEEILKQGHHATLVAAYKALGNSGPAFIMLSFRDIGGALIEGPGRAWAAFSGPAIVPDFHKSLLLPEVYVESFADAAAQIYEPLFDMVWNTTGRVSAPRKA
jgi:Putative DNA-binding domain